MKNPRPANKRQWGKGIAALALVTLLVITTPGLARTKAAKKSQVMIVGVYHFANPNRDFVKTNVDSHLSEKRQQQIREVISLLAAFKPTKIALEGVDGRDPLATNYRSYLQDEYELRNDERDQLGMRLARVLGLSRVYLIDHQLLSRPDAPLTMSAVVAAAQRSNDQRFLGQVQAVLSRVQDFDQRKASMTIRQILVEDNSPERIAMGREIYLQMTRVRDEGTFIGADVAAAWYQRNFRIFSNLSRLVESDEDRILVFYGSGHLAILRELVQSSSDMQLVEPTEYLKRSPSKHGAPGIR